MKKLLIPLSVIILLLSASFGLAVMNHMFWQGHLGCPFQAAGDCTLVRGPLSFAASHLSAFSRFFTATPVNSFAFTLFSLLALSFFIIFRKNLRLLEPQLLSAKISLNESFVPPSKNLLINWLALRENSPSFI